MPKDVLSPRAHSRGGIHVAYRKNTMNLAPVLMPDPDEVILPMSQCIGAPCTPCVSVGDHVYVGQKIGDSEAYMSVPVHASVSGEVTAIKEVQLASGVRSQAVVIKSDGLHEVFAEIKPPSVSSREDFIAAVRASGAVGLGGAGFPTHVKLNIPEGKSVDTIIVNAAECEPYITVDYREALDNSWDIVSGLDILKEYIGAKDIIIAIEDNKSEAFGVLKNIADKDNFSDDKIKIMRLKSKYPQGAEKALVYSVTGRCVPEGGLPLDVNCMVINANTVAFIARYIKTGMPLVRRTLTVDGSAVGKPKNVRVAIGTRASEVLAFAGADEEKIKKVLFGGPMMGTALCSTDVPVCKQNNAILAFTSSCTKKETACINCGKCASVCPMSLTPTFLMKAALAKDVERLKKLGAMSCMECGSCAYSCPAGKPLVQYLRLSKQLIKEAAKK